MASNLLGNLGQEATSVLQNLEACLVGAPSLRLHFTVKRSSMKIHGQSEFDVFANPVLSSDNSSVLYDGIAAFLDGPTVHNYLLVDGIAYTATQSLADLTTLSAAECLPSHALPPLDTIVAALNEATPITGVSAIDETIRCSSESLFQISFDGADFALCSSGASGFAIYGTDLNIEVAYLLDPVAILEPILSTATALMCETVATATSVTPTTIALLTGETIAFNDSRELESGPSLVLPSSHCSCQSTPRPCIFFHGLGQDDEKAELQDSSEQFGDMTEHAPCCSSIKYAALNTVDYAWTNATLQQKACSHAISVSNSSSSSSKVIEDTIIITHSMGGLMLGAALASGHCSFGSNTTWVSLSAPMTGSMGSNYLQEACDGYRTVMLQAVATLLGRCPVNLATLGLAYQNETYSSLELNAAYAAAQEAFQTNVSAVICSDNYSGLFSTDEPVYWLGGSVISHKSQQNDGIVEFQSCAGGIASTKFGGSYRDPFYLTGLNHADTSFRHGDGLFTNTKKPVKWFECLL